MPVPVPYVTFCSPSLCVAPTAAPESLTARIEHNKDLLDECVALRWAPPPAAARNGELTGYQLRYASYEQLGALLPAYAGCAYQLVRAFLQQQPQDARVVPYEGFFNAGELVSAATEVPCERLTAAELDRLPRTAHVSVAATATTARFCNPNKWTLYFVWVAAANRAGTGDYSPPTLILTPQSGARCSLSPCIGFVVSNDYVPRLHAFIHYVVLVALISN